MKALAAVALLVTAIPALAAEADPQPSASSQRERKICTRFEQRSSSSRMSTRRVCLTEAQWREQLGPDWRQQLAGRQNVEDDLDAMEARTHITSEQPGGLSGPN